MALPDLNGNWVLDRDDDNFEEFLRQMGANFLMRKAAKQMKPSMEISQDGDRIRIKMATMVKTDEAEFTVGQDFERKHDMMGCEVVISSSWDGNKLVMKLTPKDANKGKEHSITREIVDGILLQTMEIGSVTTVRRFKKK